MKHFFGFNKEELSKVICDNKINRYSLIEYLMDNTDTFCTFMEECVYQPSINLADEYFNAVGSDYVNHADKEVLLKKYSKTLERHFKQNKAAYLRRFIDVVFNNISHVYSTLGTDGCGIQRVTRKLVITLIDILKEKDPFPRLLMLDVAEIAANYNTLTNREYDYSQEQSITYKNELEELKRRLIVRISDYEYDIGVNSMPLKIVMRVLNVMLGTTDHTFYSSGESMLYKLKNLVGNGYVDNLTDEEIIMATDIFQKWGSVNIDKLKETSPKQLNRIAYIVALTLVDNSYVSDTPQPIESNY